MKILKVLSIGAILLLITISTVVAQSTAEAFNAKPTAQPKPKEKSLPFKQIFEEKSPAPFTPEVASTNNYVFTTGQIGSLTDMSSGTTQLVASNQDDTASIVNNLGFDFFFQGVRFSQFSANSNGLIRLGGAAVQGGSPYKPLAQAGLALIAPYGADQRTLITTGKVHFKVIGTAPNRVLVIEWLNMQSNFNSAGTLDLTYQARLFETTGAIEFVYGTMNMSVAGAADSNSRDPNIGFSSGATAGTVGSVTAPQSGTPAPTYSGASAVPVANLYTAGNIAVLSSAADGTRRTFDFVSPAPSGDPSGINFSGVTATGMTVNWTDTSSNEAGFAVYRSTDGINFTFAGQAAENATSFPDSGLLPSINYTYKVFAVTEGALSAALVGSQATAPPGNISANAAGGVWSSPATWVGGVVPTNGDNVTIATGATVTVDTAAAALSLTVASGGTLTFDSTAARTLTVGGDVTVNSGGVFNSASTGTVTTHVLSVAGNLTNNGTLDFSTNGNTAGATILFPAGSSNVTFGGTGPTTNIRAITVNKGAQATVVELNTSSFTVQGVNTNVAGFLTLTSGTFKISGTFSATNRIFASATYTIPALGGIWLNNPNFAVSAQAGGTTSQNNGLFRLTQGTYNFGVTGADGFGGGTGAVFIIEGGTINATRLDPQNAVTWNQTGGTINVGVVANTRSNFGTFELFSASASFTMTGGTFNLVQASTAATPVDFRVLAASNISGGVVNVGTSATAANFNFRLAGNTPSINVDNTTNNKTATFAAQTLIFGNLTVNTGTTANLNGFLVAVLGSTLTNNGTLTGTTANSRLYFLGTGLPQTYTGAGVVTAGLASFDVDNPLGVTIDPGVSQIVVLRTILFSGSLYNTNKLTLGNGGTTAGIVQIGNTTTPTAAGIYDTAPAFNLGTGGQLVSYLRTTIGRTTGPEINPTRTLTNLTYDDNNGIHQLSVAGGGLTVTGILTLTNGVIVTGSNQLTHNGTATRTLGYVNGQLNRSYTAIGTYTYHVGQNGYAPVLANVTALGTNPSSLQLSSTDAFFPGVDPAKSISRSWNSVEVGDLTADLSFTYQAADVHGNEADYRVYGPAGNLCSAAPCVNTATHVVGPATGTTSFGRFTAGESQVPTVITTGSISGRTVTSGGTGIVNVPVKIGGGDLPQPIFTTTTSFGAYRFDNLTIGQTYIITIAPKKYFFPTTVRLVTLSANEVFVDFISNP
ncbi:MAG: G8 domain-containing protein [Acidobacteriota bacterium]